MNRQHLLLAVLGVVGLANAGDWVLNSAIQGPLNEKRERTAALEEAIEKRTALLKETRAAGLKIDEWRKQSLPADAELARSLYRSWLHDRVNEAGLVNATVDSGSPSNRRGLYAALPFSVRARGTLDQFTRLMFDFDQAGHLQRVEDIGLTPVGTNNFDISLRIEALIVSGSKRRDRLSRVSGEVLASNNLADYSVISRKNVFGIGYRDPLAETVVTAITWRNGQPRVWITNGTGEVVKLSIGEELEVPDFRGRIVSASDGKVVFAQGGESKVMVLIGDSLATARPVE